ncbi:MAG TPA: alpha/beta fold hydrolase [Pyrinomonadaceae bacterium]|nr:alpha/beta fold hydrolase [Pyrinomonadaceae bacterium]
MLIPVASRWISRLRPQPQSRLRLFCFPYAGGGAPIYHSWPNELPPTVEVCAIQLPGRGPRMMEKPFRRMPALVSALTDALLPLFDKPFAFFGHSMGAWIGFELARRLQSKHRVEPQHLFVSGAGAPHVPSRELPLHALPEAEFREVLGGLNGTPKELLESDELMQLMLPILRADFAVCETYTYRNGSILNCPITAFGGLQDRRLYRSDIKAWRAETNSSFSMHMFPGNHFFLHTAAPLLLPMLNAELNRLVSGI